jgi:hypothetical protein
MRDRSDPPDHAHVEHKSETTTSEPTSSESCAATSEATKEVFLSWNLEGLLSGGYLLPAGGIDPTGQQERDVRACRLGGWVCSLASECFVLEHTPPLSWRA